MFIYVPIINSENKYVEVKTGKSVPKMKNIEPELLWTNGKR